MNYLQEMADLLQRYLNTAYCVCAEEGLKKGSCLFDQTEYVLKKYGDQLAYQEKASTIVANRYHTDTTRYQYSGWHSAWKGAVSRGETEKSLLDWIAMELRLKRLQ